MIDSVARELERRTAGDQLHPDLPRSVHARDEGHRAPVLRDRRCVLDPGPVRQAMHANYRRRRRRDREARDCEREDACRDGNNRSGWSNRRYDGLIHEAAREMDAHRRFAILREAEALLLDQGPALPVYHYSTNELVKPYVRGIYQTPLDIHPLTHVWIDRDWRSSEQDAPAAMAEPGPR